MNEYFEQHKGSFILLALVLLLLALVLYFLLIRPNLSDYKDKITKIEQLNEDIQLLAGQIESLESSAGDFSLEQLILENKIPTKRDLDEYILMIQQLEFHTNSKIEKVDFTYDSHLEVEELEEDEADEELEADASDEDLEENPEALTKEEAVEEDAEINEEVPEDAGEEGQKEEDSPSLDPEFFSEMPANLHAMTLSLEVMSPDFDEFIKLLKLIEKNERISIVTSLQFKKPTEAEIYFEDDPIHEIAFRAEITTFYYDDE